jgi:glycine cleavage system H protein
VNKDPSGEGWFFKIQLTDEGTFTALMDEDEYTAFVEAE